MRRISTGIALVIIALFLIPVGSAQQTSTSTVPNLIRYSGTLKDIQSAALSGTAVGVTFAIYKQQDGGAPVWLETQNVTPDASGQYSVILGSTTATGLPSDLFLQQEQRWLGVQVQGQPEQARMLLVSVPYAFKASEAEKLAGHSASDFVTADGLQSAVQQQLEQQTAVVASGVSPAVPSPYIINGTILQTGANFNIDGSGSAAIFNATKLYKLAGTPVLGTTGTKGLFLGAGAGQNNTGSYSTFLGISAGQSNTTASNNTFAGYTAGYHNTTGSQNTFFGMAAGYVNTTGSGNTFLGFNAGSSAGAAASNDVYISNAGAATDNGVIRIGDPAHQTEAHLAGIYGATTSSGAAVFVDSTGKLGTKGGTGGTGVTSFNGRTGAVLPASGDYSFTLLSGTLADSQLSGTYTNALTLNNASNFFAGSFTGNGIGLTGVLPAGGSPNYIQNGTAQQASANFNISGSGLANSFNSATNYGIGGSSVVSIGSAADSNLFLGVGAGASNTAGQGTLNTFSGYQAGPINTIGTANSFFGFQAGLYNTTGNFNTFSGAQAGYANNTGWANTFSGVGAGLNNTSGGYNTFSGVSAGLYSTTGSYNTISGAYAGYGRSNSTTGSNNTISGAYAGYNNTTGNYNIFSGSYAGYGNTIGTGDTFSGYQAGYNNTTGNYNTFYGLVAGSNNKTGNNDIYIGNLGPSFGAESNTIRIGGDVGSGYGPQTAAYIAGIYGNSPSGALPVVVNADGQLGTTTGGGGSGVTSFNGRTGAVVPQSGDYSFPLLSGALQSSQLSGTYSNPVTLSNGSNSFTGGFTGNGAGLTGVQFSQLSGTLASAQLSGTYNNAVTLSNGSNSFAGSFTGNGAGLTGLVNHARQVVTIQQNQPYFFTINWAFAFPDTNYTVTCTPQPSAIFQQPSAWVYIFQVSSTSPASIVVEVAASGGAGDVTVHCIGVHD